MTTRSSTVETAKTETVRQAPQSARGSTGVESRRKSDGIHYTPAGLAAYLARQVAAALPLDDQDPRPLFVLDPACGEGELLNAIVQAVSPNVRGRLVLTGFDKDELALDRADKFLRDAPVSSVSLHRADFLSTLSNSDLDSQMNLSLGSTASPAFLIERQFDAVISNPPYVRTQVLGAALAKQLSARFQLTGRVDLYHAFVKAMTLALRSSGVLGLLTSNRFLTVQSGVSIRQWLLEHYHLLRLVDLGDTKLFDAAVLPAIVIARRSGGGTPLDCEFIRVYETPPSKDHTFRSFDSVLDALEGSFAGEARVRNLSYWVETGRLDIGSDRRQPWSMTSRGIEKWLAAVRRNSAGIFSDFGKVSVGIKTTADSVFIRDDWMTLPEAERPEHELLHPLVTHHIASRWRIPPEVAGSKRVLYPYDVSADWRVPVDLRYYPRARAYFEKHRQRLEGRSYVTESGREWYEIWVPQRPKDWDLPKVAFPDISQSSSFFVVEKGWIVNGDCYWIKLLPGKELKWLWLMLAVANSTFILKFYDALFHNKLYSGRRRFMSQYVNRFPVPKFHSASEIFKLMPVLLDAAARQETSRVMELETAIDDLVWQAFGLVKEVAR
jgi:adenine-specific DNA-methyltransferase